MHPHPKMATAGSGVPVSWRWRGVVLRSRSLAPYSVAWETRGWRQPVIPKEISFEELSGSSKHHKQRLLCCAPSVLEDKN